LPPPSSLSDELLLEDDEELDELLLEDEELLDEELLLEDEELDEESELSDELELEPLPEPLADGNGCCMVGSLLLEPMVRFSPSRLPLRGTRGRGGKGRAPPSAREDGAARVLVRVSVEDGAHRAGRDAVLLREGDAGLPRHPGLADGDDLLCSELALRLPRGSAHGRFIRYQ
jgi:hypothetical protein